MKVELLAKEAGVDTDDIIDFEILLYDCQESCIGGLNNELLFSARLDNLNQSYCSAMALIASVESPIALQNEPCIRLVSLFDHEEIGSTSSQGAASNFLPAIIRRLSVLPYADDQPVSSTAYERTLSSSFLISADVSQVPSEGFTALIYPFIFIFFSFLPLLSRTKRPITLHVVFVYFPTVYNADSQVQDGSCCAPQLRS